MPITKVNEDELLDRLTCVFRTHGFEGASLSIISKATGLQRASLYHRFPGGKEEMAKAVLDRAWTWLKERALTPLLGPGKPEARIRTMADRIREFFHGGQQSCLLDSLSFGSDETPIRQHVQQGMGAWVEAIAKVAREAGVPQKKAHQQAQDAIIRIQGSLVMARVLKDFGPFERTLSELPGIVLGGKYAKGGSR
ncbi:MAG: TetR/AcrR family transcriptional regulator [Nitrospirales bacterium]|nr:TetR/AcrR family transcriptional regulator [Nitrospira sp.]MDR4501996.1 TetR/AcrR family transcriptional regulator [Nitrospirales bacterium]